MLAIHHPTKPFVSPPSASEDNLDTASDTDSQEFSLSPSPPDKIALVWHHRSVLGSHVAVVVNHASYGFLCGKPVREPLSLEQSCQKRIRKKDFMSIVQEIKVSPDEGSAIKGLCQQGFLPSTTCMDAASEVLKTVDIHIPFPVSLLPDVSRLYLNQLDHPRLCKQVSFGSLRFPNASVITQTFISLGYSYAIPRLILGRTIGHQVGLLSAITVAYLQAKAFYQIRQQKVRP